MNASETTDDESAPPVLIDVQLHDVANPTENDVLSGRGVTTNRHEGNTNFRSLVSLNKELYVTSSKRQKMQISRSIVDAVRSRGGRFLEKDPSSGLYSDIGDRKAIEKTSQALRDGAASLRKQLSADLGDPDFLSAVFENDASTESGTANKQAVKEKPKPAKAKTLPKKSHRRTRSDPDSLAAVAKQKSMMRKMKSMDVPLSPKAGAHRSVPSMASPQRVHSQPVSPARPVYIQSSLSFDQQQSAHYRDRSPEPHRPPPSRYYQSFHDSAPDNSFDHHSWHHPLSPPHLQWQQHSNPRRYGSGQPPMSPHSGHPLIGSTPPHSPVHYGHQHHYTSYRSYGAYPVSRSPIRRSYSSNSYGFGPPPVYSPTVSHDDYLEVPDLGRRESSPTSDPGHPLSPRRSSYSSNRNSSSSHEPPKEFLPPLSPASSRRQVPKIERTPSNVSAGRPDAHASTSPTISSTASYKENNNSSKNIVTVKLEPGDDSPTLVVSNISMDEGRSDTPERPEIEIVLDEDHHSTDQLDREWPGLTEWEKDNMSVGDPAAMTDASMSPLAFERSSSDDGFMDITDELLQMPIAPCGPHDDLPDVF